MLTAELPKAIEPEFAKDARKAHEAIESLFRNLSNCPFPYDITIPSVNLKKHSDGCWIATSEIRVKVSGTSDK